MLTLYRESKKSGRYFVARDAVAMETSDLSPGVAQPVRHISA